jgi:polysaccharide biosynthesis/export protein
MVITTNHRRSPLRATFLGLQLWIFLAIVLSQKAIGQASQQPTVSSQTVSEPSLESSTSNPILIGAGDLIDIEVFSTPELSGKFRVDEGGSVTLPLGGSVKVGGLTVSDAASAVEHGLQTSQIMTSPKVTVFVIEYATQGITILGEVRTPGTFTLLGSHTLYDALAAAGGVTANEGATITITHAHSAETPKTIQVTTANYSVLQKTTMIRPGDLIFVSKADMVYVVGDVGHSGAFYIQNGQHLTILNLITLAAGPNRTAALSRAAVVRKVGDDAQTIPFDLAKVMKNEQPNLVLQPNDVVVIPRSGLKTFAQTTLPQLTGSVFNAVVTALILQ